LFFGPFLDLASEAISWFAGLGAERNILTMEVPFLFPAYGASNELWLIFDEIATFGCRV
jgi:hypothetical protein